MNLNDYILKYKIEPEFLIFIENFNLGNTELQIEYKSTISSQYQRIKKQVDILKRAGKVFFGANQTLKNLEKYKNFNNKNIWVSGFRKAQYSGKIIRDKNSSLGIIIIEDGIKFKTPPQWDGTMDMLLKYNNK